MGLKKNTPPARGDWGCEGLGTALEHANLCGLSYIVKVGALYYPLGKADVDNFVRAGVPYLVVGREGDPGMWSFLESEMSPEQIARARSERAAHLAGGETP